MDFMKQALILARHAAEHGDVPIGAVIVRDGKIIARGENLVQKKLNPTLHSQKLIAINRPVKTGAKIFRRLRHICFAGTLCHVRHGNIFRAHAAHIFRRHG